jgi:pimeloyl-ACP methyl ester carboxylesterase
VDIDLIQKYTTKDSRFLVFDDTLIHYRDEGDKDNFPLLLLHGAFSSLHTYNAWAKELKNDFRIIRIDMPGFGLTGPNARGGHETMKMYERCIATVLDRLGIEKCHIAGSSLGGWVSWEFAATYPEKIEKMVLISAAGFMDQRNIPLPFKMAKTPFVNKIARYAIKRNILEQFVKQVYWNQEKVSEALIDRYYDLFTREGNPEVFFKMANTDYEEETEKLRTIKIPTLLMWGRADKWIPIDNAYRFNRRLENSEVLIYDNCGHLPMEELPRRSSNDVRAFLLGEPKQNSRNVAKRRPVTIDD